jgi:hypothetical protein
MIGRPRGDTWLRIARVLAPLSALALEGLPALMGALLVQEGGLWLARRLVEPRQARTAGRLFVAAYACRVAIVVPTHLIAASANGNGALFRDDYTNDIVGEWLVRIARGDGIAIFPGHQYVLASLYSYLLMGVYAVFGYTPLLPKLINVALAALGAVLVFDIARKLFGFRPALLSGLGAAFLPSLVVWSIASLKETLVLVVALLALWGLQRLSDARSSDSSVPNALVLLLASGLVLLDLRTSAALLVLGLLCVILLARSRVRLRPWQTALASLAVVGMLCGGLLLARIRTSDRPISTTLEDVELQIRHRRAQEAAGAASQFRDESPLDVVGSGRPAAEAASDAEPFSLTGDVLNPLGFALLAPMPWQSQSLAELGASAEMPVWYVLLVASTFAVRVPTSQRLFRSCLVAYGVVTWFVLAAVEGNVGNLLRHRLMLDPMLLIMGAAGLDWLWRQRVRAQAAREQPTSGLAARGRQPAAPMTSPVEHSLG